MHEKLTLKQWRIMREISQEELAKTVGVSTGTIGIYEREGFGSATFATVVKILSALTIELNQLNFEI